jgi:hypothetical protein
MARPRDRAARPALTDAAVVLGVLLLLGVVGGVVWWLLVDPAAFTKLPDGGVMQEDDLGRQFAADGWYVVVAGVAGLVAGLGLSTWRTRDALLTSVLLVVGSVLAAVAMALTGHLLGPGDPAAALRDVAVGGRVPEPLGVDARAAYLAWPLAVLLGAVVVLLDLTPRSRDAGRDATGGDTAEGEATAADPVASRSADESSESPARGLRRG